MLQASEGANKGQRNSVDNKGRKFRRLKVVCDQCRQRKIKCDRVIPCKNCVNRKTSELCSYSPEAQANAVTQTVEISNLRKELSDLKIEYQVLEAQVKSSRRTRDDKDERVSIQNSPSAGNRPCHCQVQCKRCMQSSGYNTFSADELLVDELLKLQQCCRFSKSLSHPVPRLCDTDSYQDASAHPFSALWDATKKAIALVKILPERKDIHKCIQVFNDNIQSFGLPLQSGDNLGKDIALFLSDLEVNAEKCPSMLAFIFVILSQGTWLLQSLEQATPKQSTHRKGGRESDVYLSAAMHSLTLSSYLNRPTLLALETLILINVYLINTGRFLDAYSLFGSITKLAQMIGLHRDPTDLPNAPSDKECNKRRALWWWLLYADASFSITLGRPLGISSYGDCRPPSFSSDGKPSAPSSLFSVLAEFTALSRQILGAEILTNDDINYYTERLSVLSFKLPSQLRFCPQWLDPQFARPHPSYGVQAIRLCVQINTYLVLLNRRWCDHSRPQDGLIESADPRSSPRSYNSVAYTRVITSCRAILQAFRYLRQYTSSCIIDWSICQCAYNAAAIMGMSFNQTRNSNDEDISLISEVCHAFKKMADADHRQGLPGGLPEQGWKSLRNFSSPLFKDAQNGQLPFPQSWGGERVLGGHGMILLEDPGLMDHNPSSDTFNPLDWSDLLVDDDGTGVKDWHGETSAEPSFEITADVTPADFPKGLFVRDIPVRSASSSTQSELGDDPETSKRSREQPSLSPKPSCFTTTCKRRKTEGEDMLPPEKPSAGLTHASTKKSGHTAFAIAGSAELTKQIFAKGLAPIVGGTSHEVRENFADSSIPATLDHTRTSEVRPLPFDPSQSKGLTPLHSASVKARNELEGLARVNFNASLPMTESLSEPVDYPATSVPMTQSFSEPILQRHTAIPYTPESEVPMCKPQLTLPHQQANTLCHPLQSEEQSLGRERVLNHRDSYFTSYFTPLPTPTIPGPLLIHSKAAPPQTSQVLYPLDTNTAMDQMSYFSSQPLFASTAVAASVPNLNATGNADTMDQLTTNTYNHNVSAIDSIAGQPLSPIPPDPMNLDRHEDHILPSNHMVDMDLATMMPEAGIQPNLLQTPPGQVRWVSTSMGV